MWSREVFDVMKEGKLLIKELEDLTNPGVYILYRDDHPHYVGKTKGRLFSRLHDHSNKSSDRYFNFWNYFSVFVVPDPNHVDEIEGILIASMTTANSAAPRIRQIQLPGDLSRILRAARRSKLGQSSDSA
jgi:hypothetical protein